MIRIVMSSDEVIEIEALGELKQKVELTNNNGVITYVLLNK